MLFVFAAKRPVLSVIEGIISTLFLKIIYCNIKHLIIRMSISVFVIILFLLSFEIFSQADTINFDSYRVIFSPVNIYVTDINDDTIYTMNYHNAYHLTADLDNSGTEELIIIDSLSGSGYPEYILYLYVTDDFRFIDSLISPVVEPYQAYTEDIESMLIVTGDDRFTDFLTGDIMQLPIICWAFDGEYLVNVNNLVYDVFISENDYLTDFISENNRLKGEPCQVSISRLSAIVSVYVNYLNAGENSLAEQFINLFYLCEDKELLKRRLISIYKNR